MDDRTLVPTPSILMTELLEGIAIPRWLSDDAPLSQWLRNHLRAETRATYARHLLDFTQWLAEQPDGPFPHDGDPREASFAHLLRYRDMLMYTRGLAPSTVRTKLMALASAYGFLFERGLIQTNPLIGLALPEKGSVREKRAWTLEEIGAFRAAIPRDGHPLHLRDRCIFDLLWRNGLRVSELCGLRMGSVTLREGLPVLELRDADPYHQQSVKGGKSRTVVLKRETLDELKLYLRTRGLGEVEYQDATRAPALHMPEGWRDTPLFLPFQNSGRTRSARPSQRTALIASFAERAANSGQSGTVTERVPRIAQWKLALDDADRLIGEPIYAPARFIDRSTVYKMIRHYGALAGLDPAICHPHAGRVTFVSWLVTLDVNIADVMVATGHKRLETVWGYYQMRQSVVNNAARHIPY